jgi:hypothetical protein
MLPKRYVFAEFARRTTTFPRRFFFVCAGLLCLALAYHLGAKSAVAKAPGGIVDVAILTGVLDEGQEIPLPKYPDGTVAPEGECQWMVSPHTALDYTNNFNLCSTEGRRVHVHGNLPYGGKADYMIVAVRRG